jgi:hypothetical protein
VRADAERVPQREFQAIRAHQAAGADGDGMRRLVPGLGHIPGHGKPVVGIDAGTGAPGHPAHPAGQFTVGQVMWLTPHVAWPRGHQHRLHLLPSGLPSGQLRRSIVSAAAAAPHPQSS